MNTAATQVKPLPEASQQRETATDASITADPSSSPQPSPQPNSVPSPTPAKVTVEIPANSNGSFDPFDPTWIKLWEQAGPIGYLGLMCLFVWLLTRLVQTVKGK